MIHIILPGPISPELKALARQCHGTEEERFWRKVFKEGPTQPHCAELGRCWIWIGSRSGGRYGCFRFRGKSNVPAHRVSWIMEYGEIPEGIEVCHKCDLVNCIRPTHLFLSNHKGNMQDATAKGRFDHRKGMENGRSTLTDAQVLALRERYQTEKKTAKELGIEYGITTCQVIRIVRRQRWNHI